MADTNEKWSQWDIVSSDDISSVTRIPILDTSLTDPNSMIPIGDLSGTEGNKGLLYYLYLALNATYIQIDYDSDSTNYLNLGLASAYRYVEIEYIMERGTKYRGGTIKVIHDGTNSYANDSFQGTEEDCSWTVIADEVTGGTQMQIQIDCDDSDANDTKFKYRITKRIPIAS